MIEIGYIGTNKVGEKFKIVDQFDPKHFLIEFDNGYQKKARKDSIKNGSVETPYTKTKYGVGFVGEGPYRTITDQKSEAGKHKASDSYTVWNGMMARCYHEKATEYKRYGALGVTVCDDWFNFQTFSEFFYRNRTDECLYLDKDILKIGGTKLYSPETCVFVPAYINNIIVHQKNVSNGLPIGVWYDKYGCVAKYTSEIKKQCLGYFMTPYEAHKAWQIAKQKVIIDTLDFYKNEKFFNYKVYFAMMERVEMLQTHINNGMETIVL